MTVIELAALGTLGVNFIAAIIGLTWGVGRVRDQVKDNLSAEIDELVTAIAEAELRMERRSGEVGNALREKVREVELFVRDNYVREKDFDAMLKMFDARFDRLQDGLEKLSAKMDQRYTTT
jgi:hypothetical protein